MKTKAEISPVDQTNNAYSKSPMAIVLFAFVVPSILFVVIDLIIR